MLSQPLRLVPCSAYLVSFSNTDKTIFSSHQLSCRHGVFSSFSCFHLCSQQPTPSFWLFLLLSIFLLLSLETLFLQQVTLFPGLFLVCPSSH